MKRSGLLVLVAAAIVAVLGVWCLASTEDPGSAKGSAGGRTEKEARGTPAAADLDAAARPESGDEAARSDARPPVQPTPAVEEEPGYVRGVVVDGRNRAIAGAVVRLLRSVGLEWSAAEPAWAWREVEEERRSRELGRTICGAEGKFEIRIPSGRPAELCTSAQGFGDAISTDVWAGQNLTVVLRHGAILSGVVRRKEGGAPVSDARMAVVCMYSKTPTWMGKTDEKGAYLAQDLPSGSLVLLVRPNTESESTSFLVLAEGETRVLDVTVGAGLVVVGEVKDGGSGQPIAGADVSTAFDKVAKTDESGHYELSGVSGELSTIRVEARARSYGKFEIDLPVDQGPVLRADFELVHGRVVHGRVVDRAGAPVAGAYVAAIGRLKEETTERSDRISTSSGADGTFRLEDVRIDTPHGLFLRKERYATTMDRAIAAGVEVEADLGDVVLPPGASLEGRVVTSAGDPIRDATVVLRPEEKLWKDVDAADAAARTDSQGGFRFVDLAAGSWSLTLDIEGVPSGKDRTISLAEGEAKHGLEIRIAEGRSISGRVVDPQGVGIENVYLTLTSRRSKADAEMRSRADGGFQFVGLAPGEYDLEAGFPDEYGPPDDRYRLIATRAEGIAAGSKDLVLKLRRSADIAGSVTTPDGAPVAHALVVSVDAQGKPIDVKNADANGEFHLQAPTEEPIEIRAWLPVSSPDEHGFWNAAQGDHPPALKAGVRAGDKDVVLVVKP